MTTIKYIGRTTDFRGKTLWEIVGNLKNFGVGRVVVRSMFERYPEPSYMKIVRVEALHNEETRKVKVIVEKTFRGRKYEKPVTIMGTSYKADYRLLSKHEEASYSKQVSVKPESILPQTIDFPPLLKRFIIDETGNLDPKLKLIVKPNRDKFFRQANDGEVANVEVTMGLGKPASSSLYKAVL